MVQITSGVGRPAEIRIKYPGNDGRQHTYTLTASVWDLRFDCEAIPLDISHYGMTAHQQFSAGRQTAVLRLDGVAEASPPLETLAVQMARAVLEGDNVAAKALADVIVNNPEEAFACASF